MVGQRTFDPAATYQTRQRRRRRPTAIKFAAAAVTAIGGFYPAEADDLTVEPQGVAIDDGNVFSVRREMGQRWCGAAEQVGRHRGKSDRRSGHHTDGSG